MQTQLVHILGMHGKKVACYGKTPLSLSLRRHSHGLASLPLFSLASCPPVLGSVCIV